MEGFKKLPKMQSFKTGGSVKAMCYGGKMKNGGHAEEKEMKADLAQDKALVKKGVRQHEGALHKGSPKTELKLKTGGRTKKACGTVKKFKTGGEVNNVYEAKKKSGDKDNIKKVKQITPTKANASSAAGKGDNTSDKFKNGGNVSEKDKKAGDKDATVKTKMRPSKADTKSAAMKKGGKVKKFSEGKMVKQAGATEAQSKFYQDNMSKYDKKAKEKDYEVFGSRGDAARKGMAEGRMDALGNPYKKGGKAKVKKYADGGTVFSDEETKWLGGADRTDPIILARMRAALGNTPKDTYPNNAPYKRDDQGAGNRVNLMNTEPKQNYIPNRAAYSDNRDIISANQRITPLSGKSYAELPYDTLGAKPAAPRPVRSAPVKPETSADLDPYGTTRRETAADLDPYGNANKPAPYIDIPQRAAGMQQFKQDATSPAGDFWNWLTTNSYKNQRNKRRG